MDIIVAVARVMKYENFNYENDVDVAYKLQSKLHTPPIIIMFKNRSARTQFFYKRKQLKDVKVKDLNLPDINGDSLIFINESLTIVNAILFKKVRQRCKTKQYKYYWTINGKIMCRKSVNSDVITITNEGDIEEFIK